MENLDALLAILCSSNLLPSLWGVQQPCEDPSVDSSSISELKEFSLFSLALTQCPPGRVSRILSDSCFYLNSQQSSFVHSLHLLNAHLAELHRTPREFLSPTMFFSTALPPRYSFELMISVHVPTWHAFVWTHRIQKCFSALAIRTHNILSHPPGMKPQRPLKPEIKNSCKWKPKAHIYSIKEHSQTFIQHRIHAGKIASVYIKNGKCL